jgi:hypothetical protein
MGEKLALFGRYNYSPSNLLLRGNSGQPLSILSPSTITTQTGTIGGTWSISNTVLDDFRSNYSRSSAASRSFVDTFGGAAIPSTAALLPLPYTTQNAQFLFYISSLTNGALTMGNSVQNLQTQMNIVNTLSWQHTTHAVKMGIDYRRLPFHYGPLAYFQEPFFSDVPSAVSGTPMAFSYVIASQPATLIFQNLGIFAQDTWRVFSRLTMTYGLRWDVDVAPSSSSGPALSSVTKFNDPSLLGLAAQGTPPFATKYGNVAPRLGFAYQISQHPQWETVVRGGVGLFYDLATQEVGNLIAQEYPFFAARFSSGGSFPLDAVAAAPPPFAPPSSTNPVTIAGFDPKLTLPYTIQWNSSIEQSLGKQQAITISYVGAAGRRLIQTENLVYPNPNIAGAVLVSNAGVSDYDAMQMQFNRRLSRGLQALLSYTWAHSIDTGSASSGTSSSNLFNPEVGANANRGPSDFDIRNAFSAGLTYQIPAPTTGQLLNAVLRGWSMQSVIQARSSPPVNVFNSALTAADGFGPYTGNIRPDLVAGKPLYLNGSEYPGGESINNTANQGGGGCIGPFCPPPTSPNGIPLRQGNLGRNALRGFGAGQWDLAVHRDFPIRESLSLQFRAEMFNVLNHPNFGQPNGDLSNAFFGRSTQMLGHSLDQTPGGGSFSALYQIGGPRSIQFALRVSF